MADGSLARRYAKALVDLGREEGMGAGADSREASPRLPQQQGMGAGNIDRFLQDLRSMQTILTGGNGELMDALDNPGITLAERKAVLGAVVGRVSLHPYVKNFLGLLIDKNRFALYPQILREFEALSDELAGRVQATVTTASTIDGAMKSRVEQSLSQAMHKKVIATFKVDPTLIGGVVAQVGGKVFDASVRTRLQDIQTSLLRETAEA